MKKIFFILLLLNAFTSVFAQKQQALQMVKVATKTFSDFSTAATTNSISSGYALPPRWAIRGGYVIATTTFSGGLLLSYTISCGISGNNTKYMTATNVFTGASLPVQPGSAGIESLTVPTSITLTATCTGGQLNTATQGVVEIYLLLVQMPD